MHVWSALPPLIPRGSLEFAWDGGEDIVLCREGYYAASSPPLWEEEEGRQVCWGPPLMGAAAVTAKPQALMFRGPLLGLGEGVRGAGMPPTWRSRHVVP